MRKERVEFTRDIQMPNEEIKKLFADNLYQKSMQRIDDSDVNINHLENIFTNETYYLAMKTVPLLERKVLYLSFVENVRLNDICKRLKLQKKQVLYKEVGKNPEVRIIDNIQKLKKEIINKNLIIIPYESAFIVCNNQELMKDMTLNIALVLGSVSGDFILVNIDKKEREFKSLSQEDIIWYSQSLNNNSFNDTSQNMKISFREHFNKDIFQNKNQNCENTLISILSNIEIILSKFLKNNE